MRILGASESSTFSDAIRPAIQISPGVYNDSLLIGLDFLLSEMYKRNMHAVIFLNNFWTWSGGMNQYLAWFGGGSSFYANAEAVAANRKYISDLINRRNSITGSYYYEDPAIMAWELANEPRPGYVYTAATVDAYYRWIDSTAGYIHSLDPNHLVTTGSEGTMGSLNSGTIFSQAHQSRFIDYATLHLWAFNWGWYDPVHPTSGTKTYSSALAKAESYIDEHIGYALALNKPLTMEEYGLQRDSSAYDAASPTTYRDQYYTALLGLIYERAAAGAPIAGSNFWGWGGEGRSPDADHVWRVGDPFICDPPMEKQGLNSIYDTDSTTISILRNHAASMGLLKDSNGIFTSKQVDRFALYQNYPNPCNPSTTIRYDIEGPMHVRVAVYDVLGREVEVMADGMQTAGAHYVVFALTDPAAPGISTGVYFYRIQAGSHSETKKMIIMK